MTDIQKLEDLVERLRGEDGCPWDRVQTRESLKPMLIEEAYEVVESIDVENWKALSEELGDLLLQIIFQAVIAQESGHFSLHSVIENISNKLIERHPHVFGKKKVRSARDVEENWEHIKIKKEKRGSLLNSIPKTAPALLRAQRLQERAGRVSFDWKNISDVIKKLEEELGELKKAINEKSRPDIEEELGDILFSLVNVSRFLGISAEDALRMSNEKFLRRFQFIEHAYKYDYEKMRKAGLDKLDKKWEEAKKKDM